jgi:predicted  nucleic acid-binding Zn ribbon protein
MMFASELRFGRLSSGEPDRQVDAIGSYISALFRNGSLLKNWLIVAEDHGWTVYAAAPARDAFKKANQSEFVQQCIRNLKAAKVSRPRIRFLSTLPETASDCRCPAPQAYYLFTTFLHEEPPVRCMECNGVVPLYRLPRPSKTGEYSALLTWWSNYQACDTLQMNCTVGERFGERQMSDLTSSLTKSGLAVCRELEERTGRPVYYYLFRATGPNRLAEMRRRCPSCGGEWRLKKDLHGKFDFQCSKCHLLSNIAWNIR